MTPGRVHWRWLALTLVVLAAHLMLLRGLPPAKPAAAAPQPRALVTRTVAAPPAPARAVALPHTLAQPPQPAPAAAQRVRVAHSAGSEQATAAASASAEPPAPAASEPPTVAPALPAAAGPTGGETTAFSIAPPVRLHYQVEARSKGITLQGQGQLHWRHDGRHYEAALEVGAPLLPTRRQHSTGEITSQGLAPRRFSDKARSEEAAHFERDKGAVTFSSNRPDAALLAGAQDRLSVLLQLGAMIAGDPRRFPPGTSIAVQTASTREAEAWHFTVEGEEQLQLPGGSIGTLKLIRVPRKEFDQKVELWLSPGMAYVPVRLRLTQPNGDWVDQQWSSTDKG